MKSISLSCKFSLALVWFAIFGSFFAVYFIDPPLPDAMLHYFQMAPFANFALIVKAIFIGSMLAATHAILTQSRFAGLWLIVTMVSYPFPPFILGAHAQQPWTAFFEDLTPLAIGFLYSIYFMLEKPNCTGKFNVIYFRLLALVLLSWPLWATFIPDVLPSEFLHFRQDSSDPLLTQINSFLYIVNALLTLALIVCPVRYIRYLGYLLSVEILVKMATNDLSSTDAIGPYMHIACMWLQVLIGTIMGLALSARFLDFKRILPTPAPDTTTIPLSPRSVLRQTLALLNWTTYLRGFGVLSILIISMILLNIGSHQIAGMSGGILIGMLLKSCLRFPLYFAITDYYLQIAEKKETLSFRESIKLIRQRILKIIVVLLTLLISGGVLGFVAGFAFGFIKAALHISLQLNLTTIIVLITTGLILLMFLSIPLCLMFPLILRHNLGFKSIPQSYLLIKDRIVDVLLTLPSIPFACIILVIAAVCIAFPTHIPGIMAWSVFIMLSLSPIIHLYYAVFAVRMLAGYQAPGESV